MKKLFLSLFSAFILSTSVSASELISFTINIIDEQPCGPGYPRTPMLAPTVYLDAGVLTFTAGHPDYVLNIKDEDGDVVYSTVVTSSQTTVVLPLTRSGDYVIELVMGNWLFTGYIML